VSAVHDFPAEVAGDAFLQAVGVVAADHDQLGAELVGLLEDELRRRSGRWLSMSEEALIPAATSLWATASPNRNDSGIDSLSSVAAE